MKKTTPAPTKENTLYLTIKQDYFDQIIAGTKTVEYREIKGTTYKKYLGTDEEGWPYYNTKLFSDEQFRQYNIETPEDVLYIYNDGKCILWPKVSIEYLDLAVGYNKDRDTATVEVVDFDFEPLADPKTGKPIRFDFDEEGKAFPSDNGRYCYWQILFLLGKVIKKDIHTK